MLDLSGFSFLMGQTFVVKNKNTYMQQNTSEENTFLCYIIYLEHR